MRLYHMLSKIKKTTKKKKNTKEKRGSELSNQKDYYPLSS